MFQVSQVKIKNIKISDTTPFLCDLKGKKKGFNKIYIESIIFSFIFSNFTIAGIFNIAYLHGF